MAQMFSGFEKTLCESIGPFYSLDQIEEALISLEQGRVFRPIITFE